MSSIDLGGRVFHVFDRVVAEGEVSSCLSVFMKLSANALSYGLALRLRVLSTAVGVVDESWLRPAIFDGGVQRSQCQLHG